MKELTKRLGIVPNSSKLLEWGKLVSVTGAAQVIVQLVGFLSGIIIIRLLPTKEYALYTMANSMLGTMTLLADGGIGNGVMAQGGKVWRDKQRLGSVIKTGLELRQKFAIGSLLIALPILFYLLHHHNASPLTSILIIASLIPAFFSALSDTLLEIAPKLHQDIKSLQKNQVMTGLGRFALISITIFIFPWAFVAILGFGIPRIFANFKLRKIAAKFADWSQPSNNEDRSAILKVVKRTLPGTIYYCISGQITIWLISIFGSTESIAHVGALSRLTMILTIFGVLLSSLVEPRFSRLKDNKGLLLSRFLQIQVLLFAVSAFIILMVWLFPTQVMFILGKEYVGLNNELMLMTISGCLSLMSSSVFKLSSSRGIVPPPIILIPTLILIQLLFFAVVDFKEITGALMFSIFTYSTAWIFRTGYLLFWIKKHFRVNGQRP
jgi:O-antigen/teichoic acid export membrane protein